MEADLVSVGRLFLVWGNPEQGQGRLPKAQHTTQLLQDSELGKKSELLWGAREVACPGLSGDRWARASSQSGWEMWESSKNVGKEGKVRETGTFYIKKTRKVRKGF